MISSTVGNLTLSASSIESRIASEKASISTVCRVACRVFLEVAMCLQYAYVLASSILRHWCWLPSAIPAAYLKVSTRNVASPKGFLKCIGTALNPFDKRLYQSIGYQEGLRIASDVTYQPASGLCMGMCYTFLAKFWSAEKSNPKEALLTAAQTIDWGATEECIKTQAIYSNLMGCDASVSYQEILELQNFLKDRQNLPKSSQKDLIVSLQTFLDSDRTRTLRQFVLEDLESKNRMISPAIYTLTLELDAFWHHTQHPNEFKYECIHHSIMQVVAGLCHLKLGAIESLPHNVNEAVNILEKLPQGSYLLQIPSHSLVLVKVGDVIALMDPNEGMGLFCAYQQEEVFSHLLQYYGENSDVSCKVLPVFSTLKSN